jgi:hypothetical protein
MVEKEVIYKELEKWGERLNDAGMEFIRALFLYPGRGRMD